VSASEGTQLVGLAPLFIHHKGKNKNIMLLGSKEICDYLDMIVSPDQLKPFIHELIRFFTSSIFPVWDQIAFYNLLQSSPTIEILREEAMQMGWEFTTECSKQSPFIQLPGSWEDYLLSLDKKQRHEIRRKMRRAEENTEMQWYFVEGKNAINKAIEEFLQLMANDPQKSTFLTPSMQDHMRLVFKWASEVKILQLSFLEIQKQKAASYFCFSYQNKILVYNSGFDPKFSGFSPGWVLLGNLLKWANENRVDEFDFMRGNEDYKYRFGAKDRYVVCALINRTRS
jgi:CelD/BcsL family acetyltransferase involved in cellulose biosynthesis